MPPDAYHDATANWDAEFKLAQELFDSGQFSYAKEKLESILLGRPDHAGAVHQLGLIALIERNLQHAESLLKKAVDLDGTNCNFRTNYGNVLQDLGRPEEAIVQHEAAIALNPDFAEGHFNCAKVLQMLCRFKESIEHFTQAAALKPNWADVFLNRGDSYSYLMKYNHALSDYSRAIALNPRLALAYIHRGIILYKQRRIQEGYNDFIFGLNLNPLDADAFRIFGSMLGEVGDSVSAAKAYAKSFQLSPGKNFALGECIAQKHSVADWSDFDLLIAELRFRLQRGELVATPYGFMGFSDSEAESLLAAKIYSSVKYPSRQCSKRQVYQHDKIRIGYLAGEFRNHATSYLLIGVLESHDRDRFDVYLFDSGHDDDGDIRHRIKKTCHKIIMISELSDEESASLIQKYEIDILIDLNGYSAVACQGILSFKPSPIQVNYLGRPGTMATDYMDYLVADDSVIPPESMLYYEEKIVKLPNSYQCNDDKREISPKIFSRNECGLPSKGFIFCCFNGTFKILPKTFRLWMRIIKKIDDSVLWLYENHPVTVENLRREAAEQGIDPSRLIFAKHVSLPEHLSRHRLADLFLDTLPCNAHTTASDALWVGLPVLTLTGTTFPGRVATSLLKAIDMPELIAATPEEYEAKAIELATNPEKLAALKAKLASNRLTKPLFNTKLYTKHFEAALTAMYERHQAGLPPDHIEIKA